MSLVERLYMAAAALAATGLRYPAVMVHVVSYEDAALLWQAGYVPQLRGDVDGVWHTLHATIVGVGVVVFTDTRPPTALERDALGARP